jgi:hypothetical protein
VGYWVALLGIVAFLVSCFLPYHASQATVDGTASLYRLFLRTGATGREHAGARS